MARPEKEAVVATLKEKFTDSAATVFVQYQGLDVTTIGALRAKCREAGVEFVVRKNTLATIAARQLSLDDAVQFFQGPTAFAFHADDPTVGPRVIKDFAKDAPTLEIKGGLLDGMVLDHAGMIRLAQIPPRAILLGQFAAVLQAPIVKLVRTLNAVPNTLVYALAAVRDQKESAG